jgi:uncharacterized protein YqeY
MPTTREALNEALKQSMKERDSRAVSTLRMVLAKLKDKDIEARGQGNTGGIDESAVLATLQGMIKQRRESIELYRQGNRQDLVDSESAEIAVIERFLPKQLDAEATRAAVTGLAGEMGAASIKDMGRVMAALRERYAGQMDFALASGIAKEVLSGRG